MASGEYGCGFSPSYDDEPFHVVLAFDSFKGSLSAQQACAAASEAIQSAFGDSVTVSSFPMADGGEGSLDLTAAAASMKPVDVATTDAIGRQIIATYLLSSDGQEAHIEVAQACGLPQISDVPLRPLEASTLGVGLLVSHALRAGVSRIVLYLGGTAATDAGSGVLSALGVRFLDEDCQILPVGGASLINLATIDTSAMTSITRNATWTVVTDVTAPLTGPNGSARVFAPQKGATPEQVELLDSALAHAAEVASRVTGRQVGLRAGSGAAGGLAALMDAFLDVTIVGGSHFFAEQSGLVDALSSADLVLTGEGRLDGQSLGGKVVGTVATLAAAQIEPPPVVAIVGAVDRTSLGSRSGLRAAFSLADGPADLAELSNHAADLLAARSVDVVALGAGSRVAM